MSKLALPLSTFLLFSGLLTCVSLFFSSLLACLFTLYCSHGFPTISFVAKFPLHREFFILLNLLLLFSLLALNSLLQDIEGRCPAWLASLVYPASPFFSQSPSSTRASTRLPISLSLSSSWLSRSMFEWDTHLVFYSHTAAGSLLCKQDELKHILNESLEAVSEHILVAVGVKKPYVFSRLCW